MTGAPAAPTAPHYTGGCACGAVRFTVTAPALGANYCHCQQCRRHTGAPLLLGAKFPANAVQITGALTVYASSATGRRQFCPVCGSSLFFTFTTSPAVIEIMVGVIDDPAAIQPSHHVWTENQIAWFDVADALPRFRRMPETNGAPDANPDAEAGCQAG